MEHKFDDVLAREREMEEILLSEQEPLSKVKKIMALGLDEDEAYEIVEKYQIGQMAPVYYERLEFEDDEADYE